MERTRPHVLALLGALLGLVLLAPVATAQEDAAAVPVVHLDGRGHGHGVGLSQWGAYTMARDGASAADIIQRFYPGTSLGTATGEVVVVVDTRDRVLLRLSRGGEIRSAREGSQAEGFPVSVEPGEVVEVVHDGHGYRVRRGGVRAADTGERQRFGAAQQDCVLSCEDDPDDGGGSDPDDGEDGSDPDSCLLCTTTSTTSTTRPAPSPEEPRPDPDPSEDPPASSEPDGEPVSPTPVWAVPDAGGTVESVDRGRAYRGTFEVTGEPGALELRNHVHVEDYLQGMAEVPGHWPAAAVQAQTMASRTYALRTMAAGGHLCDTESCQVYGGIAEETPGQTAAVEATRGVVVTYGGGFASTFYSASGGGHSATVQEGFGAEYHVPYLPARPYETDNPKTWQLDVALDDVAARLEYPGELTDVRVTGTGPSGRPVAMEVEGDAGVLSVAPQEFRRRLGLQSTLFTLTTDVTDEAPPPPPPPVEGDQLTAGTGGDAAQVTAVGDPDDGSDTPEELRSGTAAGAAAGAVADPGGEGAGAATVPALALALTAVAGTVTAHRVRWLGHRTAADGLGVGPVLGAPTWGLPRRGAARLAGWTNPDR